MVLYVLESHHEPWLFLKAWKNISYIEVTRTGKEQVCQQSAANHSFYSIPDGDDVIRSRTSLAIAKTSLLTSQSMFLMSREVPLVL